MPSFDIKLASETGCKFSIKNNMAEKTAGFNFFNNKGLDIFVSTDEWTGDGLELPDMMLLENNFDNVGGRIAIPNEGTYQVLVVNNKEIETSVTFQFGGSVGLTAAAFAVLGSFVSLY